MCHLGVRTRAKQVSMRRSDIRSRTASVRLLPDQNTETPRWYVFWSGLSRVWSWLESRPAFVFILLSFVFGSAISVVVPPLRGPDEIAHFLRIYSYTRGGLLPAAEVDGRKGIFVERELYTQLSFFKNAGERFARNREQGLRYSEIMKQYPPPGGTLHGEGTKFMPFAGTEGYNPVTYIPYIAAAAIGRPFKFDFPDMLILMRLFGLATFTAVAAYAIAVTPVLKWAFLLIALLPVSIYNRSVLSADGAALSSALVVTALCLSAAREPAAGRVWERSLWMTICALSKQPQIVFVLLELMVSRLRRCRGGGAALPSSCCHALFYRRYGWSRYQPR